MCGRKSRLVNDGVFRSVGGRVGTDLRSTAPVGCAWHLEREQARRNLREASINQAGVSNDEGREERRLEAGVTGYYYPPRWGVIIS